MHALRNYLTMKRLRHYTMILAAAVAALCISLPARAQQEDSDSIAFADATVQLKGNDARTAAYVITGTYRDWNKVTLSGKLHLDRLPISPSVKIYMEKGKRIIISLRAPLLGEVGTVDIQGNTFTMVNKMKRTYVQEDISGLVADLPVTLSDLQNIFLGRIFLPDEGTLSMKNYKKAQFYVTEETDGWMVLPEHQPVEYDVSCGYTTYGDGRTRGIFVSTLDGLNQAAAGYEYDGGETEIYLDVKYKSTNRDFTFTIQKTDWNGKPIAPAEITPKYKKLSLKEFFRSL